MGTREQSPAVPRTSNGRMDFPWRGGGACCNYLRQCLSFLSWLLVPVDVGKFLWRKTWQPTPVFLSGESPCTEKSRGVQSMGSQRVRHDWLNTYWCENKIGGIVPVHSVSFSRLETRNVFLTDSTVHLLQSDFFLHWKWFTKHNLGLNLFPVSFKNANRVHFNIHL